MNVFFRVDASITIGTGHVMRCLTLADQLRREGARCSFVCRAHPGHLLALIAKRGHAAIALPFDPADADASSPPPAHAAWLAATWPEDARATATALGEARADWMVVDHYAIDARWETALRPHCRALMAIDDLADRPHDCDLLLDQNWYGNRSIERYRDHVPLHCCCLLGPRYSLLHPAYAQLALLQPPHSGRVRRVLVFLGGSDPHNVTAQVLAALSSTGLEHVMLDLVLGANHPDPDGIKAMARTRGSAQVHQQLASLAGLMVRADLMIGAGGSTLWERLCLGLPGIVITLAENQVAVSEALAAAGCCELLGHWDKVDCEKIANAVRSSVLAPNRLKEQSRRGRELVMGSGAQLVADFLSGKVGVGCH